MSTAQSQPDRGGVTPPGLPGPPWCAEPGSDPTQWDEETLDSPEAVEARNSGDTEAWLGWRRKRAATLCQPCDPQVRAACLEAGVREVSGPPDGHWKGGIWGGQIYEDLVVIAGLSGNRPKKRSA